MPAAAFKDAVRCVGPGSQLLSNRKRYLQDTEMNVYIQRQLAHLRASGLFTNRTRRCGCSLGATASSWKWLGLHTAHSKIQIHSRQSSSRSSKLFINYISLLMGSLKDFIMRLKRLEIREGWPKLGRNPHSPFSLFSSWHFVWLISPGWWWGKAPWQVRMINFLYFGVDLNSTLSCICLPLFHKYLKIFQKHSWTTFTIIIAIS